MKKNITTYNQILCVIYSVFLCMSLLTVSIAKFTPIPLSFISYSFGFLYFIVESQSWIFFFLLAFTISLIAGIISTLANAKTNFFHWLIALFCFADLIIGGFILLTQISEHTIYSILGFICLVTDIILIGFIIFVTYKNTNKRKWLDEEKIYILFYLRGNYVNKYWNHSFVKRNWNDSLK